MKYNKLKNGTARERAAYILLRLHEPHEQANGLVVQQALEQALKTKDPNGSKIMDSRDAALCTELVYGCLRHNLGLEYVLSKFLKNSAGLPNVLIMVLQVALYELWFLDRIPAHATINSAVNTIRGLLGSGLGGLTNGVLRNIDRLPEAEKSIANFTKNIPDTALSLSLNWSIPQWLVQLWINGYGKEQTQAICASSTTTPWPCARINSSKPNWQNLRDELAEDGGQKIGASGIRFSPGSTPKGVSELLRAGELSWQGASSQFILEALQVQNWKSPLWDACAGRGGKTCALLEQGIGVEVASDPYGPRLKSLRGELHRLGLSSPRLIYGPAQIVEPGIEPQTILLDVPCSGTGTLARRPDICLGLSLEKLQHIYELQKKILEAAWNKLASNGHLVYITCAVNPEENHKRIAEFVASQTNAELLTQWQVEPNSFGDDLLYGALLQKK